MTNRYTNWTIWFTDGNEYRPGDTTVDQIGLVEVQVRSAFFYMNVEDGDKNGRINSDNIFLLNKEGTYEYVVFFKLHGDDPQGYAKQMFFEQRSPMKGKR